MTGSVLAMGADGKYTGKGYNPGHGYLLCVFLSKSLK